jgi:hypothetical protein
VRERGEHAQRVSRGGRRRRGAVVAALLIFASILSAGCIDQKALARAFTPPPVDLRAVPGGVEVGFVCGPGVPYLWQIYDAAHNRETQPTPTTYPMTGRATRTFVVPVPETERHAALSGYLSLLGPDGRAGVTGVPFGSYAFDFRYDRLPRSKSERIPGGDCGHHST